jgi:hypothetical protein
LSTIANQVTCEMADEAIVEWTLGFLNGQLEVVIGLV